MTSSQIEEPLGSCLLLRFGVGFGLGALVSLLWPAAATLIGSGAPVGLLPEIPW